MKKPNKPYRFLRRRSSMLAAAFQSVHRPLVSVFRTQAEREVADNFSMTLCKRGLQMVMATLLAVNKVYRGPKLSLIFASLNIKRRVESTDFHGPSI